MSEEKSSTVDRDQFFAVAERRYDTFDIAGFGSVRLQSLTDAERTELDDRHQDAEQAKFRFADRAIATVVDEDRDLLFGPGDREKLSEMDARVARKIHDAIIIHAFMSVEDIEAKKNDLMTTSTSTTDSGSRPIRISVTLAYVSLPDFGDHYQLVCVLSAAG